MIDSDGRATRLGQHGLTEWRVGSTGCPIAGGGSRASALRIVWYARGSPKHRARVIWHSLRKQPPGRWLVARKALKAGLACGSLMRQRRPGSGTRFQGIRAQLLDDRANAPGL